MHYSSKSWHLIIRKRFFHLHLKIFPFNLSIPENLVVHVEGDTMTFWSTMGDRTCVWNGYYMTWPLCPLITLCTFVTKGNIHSHTYSVGLFKKSLYMYYSNALLKEDVYVWRSTTWNTVWYWEHAITNNIHTKNPQRKLVNQRVFLILKKTKILLIMAEEDDLDHL